MFGIEFLTMSIRNFMSFGNNITVIPLNKKSSTLINGVNLDNTLGGETSNGSGKAQPLTSLIKVPSGWKKMGDIQVGNEISTPDGLTANVVGVFPQGIRPVYQLTFSDGRVVEADADHLWSVNSHKWINTKEKRGSKLLTTTELLDHITIWKNKKSNKPYYSVFVPLITPPQTNDIVLPLDPYTLGALIGDGCMTTSSIVLSSKDSTIVQQVNNGLLPLNQCLKLYTSPIDYYVRNSIKWEHTNNIKEVLLNLNLLGCKSNNKFIPSIYLNDCSTSQKLRLLQGLFDTDGTVGKNGDIIYHTVSKQLSEDVQYLVRSLGGKASCYIRHPFYTHKGEKKQGQLCYDIRISYHTPSQLFTLPRKLERLPIHSQYSNSGLRIDNVEYVRDDLTQCIMIDHPDHLYITDNFVVTHNTSILNAFVYCLYDQPISDINKDNLVNNINNKHMEVSVEFNTKGHHYKIKRERKMKAGASGNNVYVFIDGTDKTRAGKANEQILEILGIPYELFVRIAVFSASLVSFLDLKYAEQTSFMEELFGVTMLSQKADNQKALIKADEQEIQFQKSKIEALEKEHERHTLQIDSVEKKIVTWFTTQKQNVKNAQIALKTAEEQFKQKRIDTEKNLTDALAVQQTKFADHDPAYFDELRSKRTLLDDQLAIKAELRDSIKQYVPDVNNVEKRIQDNSKQINKLTQEIVALSGHTCPYCKQEYHDSQDKMDSLEQEIIDLSNDNVAANTLFKTINNSIQTLKNELSDVQDLIDRLEEVPTYQDISRLEQEPEKHQLLIDQLKANLAEFDSKTNPHLELVRMHKQKIIELEEETNPFVEVYDELVAVQLEDIDYTKLNELTNEVEHQKFLLKLLTKKDSFIRKEVLNKNIPLLNSRLQKYLSIMGLSHKISFTHEMTVTISLTGRPLSFGNLSAGQRARVNIALSLAFRDILQHIHSKINVWMLDEILDVGLDSVGVQAAAKLVKQKAKEDRNALFVISHRDECYGMFDDTMTVQMQKGFSFIK